MQIRNITSDLFIVFADFYWFRSHMSIEISAVSYAISWMRLFSLLQYHCTWLFDGNLRYVFNAGAGTAYPSGFVDRCLSEKIRRSSSYCVWRPKTTSSTIYCKRENSLIHEIAYETAEMVKIVTFQYSCENEISRSRQKRWISRKWWWIYQRNLTILPQEYSQWKVTSHLIELILYKWQRRINTLCIKFKIRTYNIFFYNKAHPVSDIWYKRAGILLTWARECMTASFH
jgi:hypothetical protein